MQNGELSHQLGFIIKGALRTFTINNQEGEDISFLLQVDSDFFFSDYECFLSGSEIKLAITDNNENRSCFDRKTAFAFSYGKRSFWIGFYKANCGYMLSGS